MEYFNDALDYLAEKKTNGFRDFIDCLTKLEQSDVIYQFRNIRDSNNIVNYVLQLENLGLLSQEFKLAAIKYHTSCLNSPERYYELLRQTAPLISMGFMWAVELTANQLFNIRPAKNVLTQLYNAKIQRHKPATFNCEQHSDDTAIIVLNYLGTNESGSHIKVVFGLIKSLQEIACIEKVELHITLEAFKYDEINVVEYEKSINYRINREFTGTKKPIFKVWKSKGTLLDLSFESYLQQKNITISIFGLGKFESIILRRSCFKYTFLIDFQFSQLNQSCGYADGALLLQGTSENIYQKRSIKTERLIVPLELDADKINKKLSQKKYSSYSKPKKLITVLGAGRIEDWFSSINEEPNKLSVIETIKELGVSWTLVGVKEEHINFQTNQTLSYLESQECINVIEFCNNLPSLYEDYDVFLQLPFSSGGGFGALTAITSGVPVVGMSDSDIASYMDKELMSLNINSYLATLHRMCEASESTLSDICKMQLNNILEKNSIIESSKSILKVLQNREIR